MTGTGLTTNLDTVLAIYTGNSVSSLTPVASNDDDGGATCSSNPFASSVSIPVSQGTINYVSRNSLLALLDQFVVQALDLLAGEI